MQQREHHHSAVLDAGRRENPLRLQDGSTYFLRLSGCRRHPCCPSAIPLLPLPIDADPSEAAAYVRGSAAMWEVMALACATSAVASTSMWARVASS